jgi:hypothetical protein
MLNRYNSLFPLWAVLLLWWAFWPPKLFHSYASAIVQMLSLASYWPLKALAKSSTRIRVKS